MTNEVLSNQHHVKLDFTYLTEDTFTFKVTHKGRTMPFGKKEFPVGPDVIDRNTFTNATDEELAHLDSQQYAYRPRGGASEITAYRGREVVIHGPAGTGKTVACLHKLYIAATKYPNMRGAIVRRFRSTITQSAMNTFEKLVIAPGDAVRFNTVEQEYRFPNGSVIVVAGLDSPEKILSTEFDLVYVQECTEIDLEVWETITSRLRWNHMPYQQLIGDCNPSSQQHWIMRRHNEGKLHMIQSKFQDNPMLWNQVEDTWTPAGDEYVNNKLGNLTGSMRERFFEGKWVGMQGICYPEFDININVINPFKLPKHWLRYISVDFGFTNPATFQWWAEDPDGRLYLYRELYGTQTMVEDWAHKVHDLSRGEEIKAIICDHDAEDRATLERHMLHAEEDCYQGREKNFMDVPQHRRSTIAADKKKNSVRTGIEKVKSRMRVAGDGRPRLMIFKGCLVEEDKNLIVNHKPKSITEEIDSYVWDEQKGGKLGDRLLEEPKKKDDHGCDAMRYLVVYVDGGYSKDTEKIWGAQMSNSYGQRGSRSGVDILQGERKDSFWRK